MKKMYLVIFRLKFQCDYAYTSGSLLNNELFTFANLILNLFADVLYQSKSDVCGFTAIHKSTYNGDQVHCGGLAPYPPTQAIHKFMLL